MRFMKDSGKDSWLSRDFFGDPFPPFFHLAEDFPGIALGEAAVPESYLSVDNDRIHIKA